MSATVLHAKPGLLDRLDLLLLRLAKRRRGRLDSASDFYESYFTEEDAGRYLGDVRSAWRFGVMRRTFDRLFPDGSADVVDVGCGLGTSRLYLPRTARFVGVDVSERALASARCHRRDGAEFQLGGFPDLPVGSACCDFAICLEVLEHLADDEAAVRELRRIVRPGGYLLVSVPSTYYWPGYRNLIGHYRHYTPRSLAALLEGGGFAVVEQFPQFKRFWRAYHYLYVALRAAELAARRLARESFSLLDSRAYRRLASAILRRLEARAHERDASSTLLLCRRESA